MAIKGKKPAIGLADEEIRERLGKRIKSLRSQQGYTNYEKFAFEHDISRAQYGRYENGGDIRFSTLVRIVKAFDITLEDFFSEGFD